MRRTIFRTSVGRLPWLTAALIVGSDQATKLLIRASLAPAQSVPILSPVLHLTYVQNTGAAFGLFRGYPGVFVVLALLVAAWIVRELGRTRPTGWEVQASLGLILGGAVGNLIDRVRFGYVVDFIDLRVWPVFNVADASITIGVSLLLIQQLGLFKRK